MKLRGKKLFGLLALIVLAGSLVYGLFSQPAAPADGQLQLYMLDVGQGDALLLRCGQDTMLIDAGTNAQAVSLVERLKRMEVTSLDLVIGTHPHEDHIGGLDAVIEAFPVETLIMPRVQHNTKTFEDVLDAAAAASLTITAPEVEQSYALGEALVTILGPVRFDEDDLNNASVVCRVDFAGRSILLAGDAEKKEERELLLSKLLLSADVLKVGHHGSNTSTSQDFLLAASPEIALISCGKNNSYGHPAAETLSRLQSAGARIYRTDQNGTITVVIDGDGSLDVEVETR